MSGRLVCPFGAGGIGRNAISACFEDLILFLESLGRSRGDNLGWPSSLSSRRCFDIVSRHRPSEFGEVWHHWLSGFRGGVARSSTRGAADPGAVGRGVGGQCEDLVGHGARPEQG